MSLCVIFTVNRGFNAEIYNSPALRSECERAGHRFRSSMDGEVILHLWETAGPSVLERLNGIFALAVFDSVTGELFLARDPLGVKPLVSAEADGELWFASELRSPLAMGAPTGGADLVALAQFLSFLRIPDPRTPMRACGALSPERWSDGLPMAPARRATVSRCGRPRRRTGFACSTQSRNF